MNWKGLWRYILDLMIARGMAVVIVDTDMRARCLDMLAAGPYDRVIREACVILEHRIRQKIGAETHIHGTTLLEQAFDLHTGMLRMSAEASEQRGALSLYQGMMDFFRNPVSHRLIERYTRWDALRVVIWVDGLLGLVAEAETVHARQQSEKEGHVVSEQEPVRGERNAVCSSEEHKEKRTDDLHAVLRQVDQQARKVYPNGWIPEAGVISLLTSICPSFRQRFHPTLRTHTFLTQRPDLFACKQMKKQLYIRLRDACPE